MATLDRRIEELERKALGIGEPLIIFRVMVRPGHLDAPSVRAEFSGLVRERAEGETDEAFWDRVKREAIAANPGRNVILVRMCPHDLDL